MNESGNAEEKEELRSAVADYENSMKDLADRRDRLERERRALKEKRISGESGGQLAGAQRQIEARMQRISRMHLCYMTLPHLQHAVLKKLYEDGCPWKAVGAELGVSRRTVLRERSAAIAAMRRAGERTPAEEENHMI